MTTEVNFHELVRLMRVHRSTGTGFCLFLGAGCSLSSTAGDISTAGVIAAYLSDTQPLVDWAARSREANYKDFVNSWLGLGLRDRNDVLAKYIPPDMEPSPGYVSVARLAAAGYLKAIVTTNFDNLIDKALARYGIDYLFHCADRPPMNPTGKPPLITLVKVHGGLHQGDLAFSPDDLDRLPRALAGLVRDLTSLPLVVVGYSGQDRGVMIALSKSRDHTVYWASPTPPSRSDRAFTDRIFEWLDKRLPKGDPFISGDEFGSFDTLFERLFYELEQGGAPPAGSSHFH